ncbi:Protein MATERNALLY EXPRESSED GENE 5 [Dichanthelium oligosanthes]|uniref:Protein MATERNALLY EXPRESSED GENE 5 n=1 Tax=Dichanthelium oligosanthes TaxID=888268 RepID=A0A1E5VC30_9POAL|nr:Protein MATERNALLY EXPRESSED GENE 5 [Dichanthelium oligosanthes]
MTGYYPRDEERAGYRAARDTEALNASYERFLRTGQIQSYGAGPTGEPIRPAVGGNAGYPVDDRSMMAARGMDSRNIGYGGGMPEPPLPPDASNTLYIEGIPTGYIFRPFVGFREVRLVNKEPKYPGGDPIVLCFVDFAEATQAAIAMDALQGETDELDICSYFLNYVQSTLSHLLNLLSKLHLIALNHKPIFFVVLC